MRALEQMGEPAEARALARRAQGRLDALARGAGRGERRARGAARGARRSRRGPPPSSPSGWPRLQEKPRRRRSRRCSPGSAPLEAKLRPRGRAEARARGAEAARGRLEALAAEAGRGAGRARGAQGRGRRPVRGLAEQLARLHAQKEALAEALVARIAALETALAAQDPQAGARPARRAAGDARAPRENPFAEISEQLTRLYAQKDATVETVFARLAPLEARLAELDPTAALDRFAERLEAVQGRMARSSARTRSPRSPSS